VRACTVFVADERLRALVVPDPGFEESAVRAHLAQRLHTGMVPATLTVVDELPRTANGKAGGPAVPATSTGPVPDSVVAQEEPVRTASGASREAPSVGPQSPVVAVSIPALGVSSEVSAPSLPDAARPGASESTQDTRWAWRVAIMFSDCLKVPQHQVKSDSDFFSIGGDSLIVAELLTRLEREAQVVVDFEALLDAPTPAEIGVVVGRLVRGL
jgi:acyl carrier protein